MRKLIMYNGRNIGKNYWFHEWFRNSIPTLKKGWTMGIPTETGIAIFKFMGIKKPKPPKIFFDEA